MCDEFSAVSSSTVGSNSCRICFVRAERDLSLESVMDRTRRLRTLSAYLSCAIFAIKGLCSSGISDKGGSCFSILDSRNTRNLTISSTD